MTEKFHAKSGEAKLVPTDMDGLFLVSEMNSENVELFEELSLQGHLVGIGHTNFEYKSPFVRVGGDEIVGAAAIRAYYARRVTA